MDKLKIAVVCTFSNATIRERLPLDNRKLYNFGRKVLGLPVKRSGYGDLSAWVTNLIDNFKTRDDVELTVVSSHVGLKKNDINFAIDGVDYYFVKSDLATLLKHLIKSSSLWNRLNPIRRHVHNIINNVHPDAVIMIGAENAFISGSVLGLEKKYPVLLKTQTVYNNPERLKFMAWDAKNAYVEKLLFERMKYVSVTNKMHYDLYRQFNKDSYNFRFSYGTTYPEPVNCHKEYDFINFALGMTPTKGFSDAIEALAIVKKSHPDVKLNLVGTPSQEHKDLYESLVSKYSLEHNVSFTPFFESHKDLLSHIQKSRFAVLPYKLDYIATTTYQAMNYGLPVVCYKTLGTPNLNNHKQCALIADMEDIESLAKNMCMLMDNPQLAEELRKNAKEKVDYINDGKRISDEIVTNIKAIIANYRYGDTIPQSIICVPEH